MTQDNRELNFRAWHPSVGKMFYWKEVKTESGYRWMFVTNGETNIAEWNNSKLIKMQHTGLLDKNGAEIYESDIALSALGKEKYVVIWDHAGWFRQSGDCGQRITSMWPHHARETIIGNIYETPELLTL